MEMIDNRSDLIKILEKHLKIMEIGIFKGEFSKFVFNEIEPSELHLVDLFEGQMCSGDKDGNNIIWTDLSQEYNNLISYFNDDENVFLHKGFSYDILSKFDDEYFDMVYIDGDHSYEGVKKDLDIAFNKVKSGGYICGHDYTMQMFEGVVRAVDEFCSEKGLKIKYITNDGCPSYLIVNAK
jgi:hypothetical protein